MDRRRTDRAHAHKRATAGESFTPLAAAFVWSAVVAGGTVWSPLSGVASPLHEAGRTLLMILALHAIHELGHVAAGLLVGMPLQAVTVGLFTVRRERRGGSGRFYLDVNRCWRRFSGCVEREVSPAPGVREALTVTALGGPLASVVAGALLVAASGPWEALGAASLLVGMLNALPVRVLGQTSDGMIVRRLWSRAPADTAWRTEVCGADTARVAA